MKIKGIVLLLWGISVSAMAQEVLPEMSVSPVADEPAEQLITYTWSDFLMGKSCEDVFSSPNESYTTALNKLADTYCANPVQAWDNLLVIFRQGKKDLLVNEALKENHLRYLKVIPLLFFDVYHRSPKGQTLADRLDRIQQAIQNKDPDRVLFLMQDLSPTQQLFLMPLFNEARQWADFKKMLEEGGDSK